MPGKGCNAQGFFINMGDTASACWTLVIAIHTFLQLAGGPNIRGWVAEKSMKGKSRWVLCTGVWFNACFLSSFGMIALERLTPENGPFCTFTARFNYN